jgi:hypothetical protein
MNTSYKLVARPNYSYWYAGRLNRFAQPTVPKMTADSLAQAFAGAVVRQCVAYDDGSYEVEIDLQRQSHAHALNEIVNALVGAGFQVAEIQVTEWTPSWFEGAIAGALGGGAIGGGAANVAGLILGALIGAEVGLLGGMLKRKVIRTLDASRNYYLPGGWQLTTQDHQVSPATPRIAY